MIELELLDRRPSRAAPPAPSAPRPNATNGRRAVAALAVGACIIAGVVALSRGGDGDDAATEPPTTVPASTVVAPSSLVLPTVGNTFVPGVGVLVPTTAPATTVGTTTRPPGPVLGAARGWSLISFNRSALSVLDLDTGRVTTSRDPGRQQGGAEQPIVLGDRVVYTSYEFRVSTPTPSVWSQRLRDEPPVRIVERASTVAASSRAGFVWIAPVVQSSATSRIVEIDSTGAAATTLAVPAGLRVAAASADGVWLTGSGSIFSLSRTGQLRKVAIGELIDASSAGALYEDCPPAASCALFVAKTNGAVEQVGQSADLDLLRGNSPTLSPDGRWLLLRNGVIDRFSGTQVRHVFTIEAWRWSPDSAWLFVESRNDGPIAWNVREQRFVSLPDFSEGSTITGIAAS